jgi:hypothetical protein
LRNWKRHKAPQLTGFGFALEFKHLPLLILLRCPD